MFAGPPPTSVLFVLLYCIQTELASYYSCLAGNNKPTSSSSSLLSLPLHQFAVNSTLVFGWNRWKMLFLKYYYHHHQWIEFACIHQLLSHIIRACIQCCLIGIYCDDWDIYNCKHLKLVAVVVVMQAIYQQHTTTFCELHNSSCPS